MKTAQEIAQELENVKRLIDLTRAHAQVLIEQQAQMGLMTPPHIVTGIETAEQQVAALLKQRRQLELEQDLITAPIVYLHTFGTLDAQRPAHARLINWDTYFQRDKATRTIPTPQVWDSDLWPELDKVAGSLPAGLVQIQGRISLSAGFALGQTLSRAGHYRLAIAQATGDYWWSEAEADDGDQALTAAVIDGSPAARSLSVVVNTLPKNSNEALLEEVADYMKGQGGSKKTLLLYAPSITTDGQRLTGPLAASLARHSQPELKQFVRQHRAGVELLHIFLATPFGLAILLGHQWNAIGLEAQFQEFAGTTGQYLPACRLQLS